MGGWLVLAALLCSVLAVGAYFRRRLRPSVEAGPKAMDRLQADPAMPAMVDGRREGAPPAVGPRTGGETAQ